MIRTILMFTLCLLPTGLFAFQQGNFPALVYHRFGDERFPSTNISLENFEAQLQYFQDNDFRVLTMSDALDLLNRKKKRMPNAVVITVDDAYLSFYQNAIPLLKKYGYPATLYVNTGTVGAPDYMSWDQLNEVKSMGIEIGNHSHNHPYFVNQKDISGFIEDLQISHEAFEKGIGELPITYAYPYGEWNPDMAYVLDTIGYRSASAQNSGIIHTNSNRYALPRFPMTDAYAGMNQFKEKINVNALEVFEVKITDTGIMGSKEKPRLVFSFKEQGLDITRLQCFIQGATPRKSAQVVRDDVVRLTVWPEKELRRRRTLFTVTVPDNKGSWHWFSYLWVIPGISETPQ